MTEVKSGGGIGFCGLLTILFIGLKLTGYITWPWLWVLSPLWIGIALFLVFLLITLIVVGIVFLVTGRAKPSRSRFL